ncbi:selenium metabolism protein YedF [Solidesulfovibrio carbinoliphilus subsp. oakridgensis]|uniref:Selenium metabolism protein YedF n=1 Tax=Solidesulfovibrio carbinoliphilus subsp. oakridgensis TaxID=694327 RepID=G7Q5W3_9BACT|nr:sulfurtransferase-like selenium metabolism protein YedF [Solidesulfovibrio carbinoliphilus]EHJ46900.1 selenium metabolism protein YedF [Solidesulfovibrio carbinoliphilus subsp. oakridgensis]
MEIALDCRGLACPGPVLRCKECVEGDRPETLTVTVDNEPARENVARFLAMRGYTVTMAAKDGLFVLTATAPQDATAPEAARAGTPSRPGPDSGNRKTVVFITADTLGRGDATLGHKLMGNFLATLPELGKELWRIILVNGGVKLAVAGSPVLDRLQTLAASGVSILVCGTCLDFFGVLDQKEVGETTNMLDVVTSLALADKVIQL